MKGILNYGRYDDDPEQIGCPRAKTDMTPCVARDGHLAQLNDGSCAGCRENPADLLTELVRAATRPEALKYRQSVLKRLRSHIHGETGMHDGTVCGFCHNCAAVLPDPNDTACVECGAIDTDG